MGNNRWSFKLYFIEDKGIHNHYTCYVLIHKRYIPISHYSTLLAVGTAVCVVSARSSLAVRTQLSRPVWSSVAYPKTVCQVLSRQLTGTESSTTPVVSTRAVVALGSSNKQQQRLVQVGQSCFSASINMDTDLTEAKQPFEMESSTALPTEISGMTGCDTKPPLNSSSHQRTERAMRKLRKKQMKADKRAKRSGTAGESVGQKACSLCSKQVDLLIRCQIDQTRKWHMVCGKCWKGVSGGVPDGDAAHPHYLYGGLWKNRTRRE